MQKTLNSKQNDVKEDDQGQDMVISENELLYHSSVLAIYSNEVWAQLLTTSVYYISDLHLAHHIINAFPNGASDDQVHEYVRNKAYRLFEGDFGEEGRCFKEPIVLFGGDIASCFSIAELFYREFTAAWREIETETYMTLTEKLTPIESELEVADAEIAAWKNKHPWTRNAKKTLMEYKSVPQFIKRQIERREILKQQVKELTAGLSYGWRDKYEKKPEHQYVYAILGNHELWDFDSFESCDNAYSSLFTKLHIFYLNGRIIVV